MKDNSKITFKRIKEWPSLLYRSNPVSIPGINEIRSLTAYLPPDYFIEEQPHPIAYFFDGQNIFEDEGTMAGGWHLHDYLDQRHKEGQVVPIVIGIEHGSDRDIEMSPWTAIPGSGKAAKADLKLDWMMKTLHPQICQKLNILNGPEHTLVGGSSLGGFLSIYAYLKHPEFFGKALAMSPSLWVGMFEIFPWLLQKTPKAHGKIYLDYGELEGDSDDQELGDIMLGQTQLLVDTLEIFGYTKDVDIHFYRDPQGKHNEASWSKRLPFAFEFLFDNKVTACLNPTS